ncbi:MAG: TonB-dependent receptor plug domain-containing protein, partial [Opitutaceae bacterium]
MRPRMLAAIRRDGRRFQALSIIVIAGAVHLEAQTSQPAPAEAEGDTVELSPFTIEAASDIGYTATSSLAGSRLRTDLKDIAAQVDVMTPEFLGDIAATNLTEAVAYSTNNGSPNEQNAGPNDGVTTTRSSGRARGFDVVTQSADFFETNLPSDFYNVERLTIANGPQSILFGLGNAGGVLDVSTKRALMRNEVEIGVRADDWGSFRTTLDVNRELAPDVLAVRLAAVYDDHDQFVEGGFNRQKRVFGALTWKLAPNTTLRLAAENVDQTASFASNFLSRDFVSPWVAAGSPLYD